MKHSHLLFSLLACSVTCAAADNGGQPTPPPAADAAPAAEAAAAPETIADGNIAKSEGANIATDATLRLRQRIAELDSKLAQISNPTRSLRNTCANVKRRVTGDLARVDKQALEIADLQKKFNEAGAGDYNFDLVRPDDRMKYVRDGEAAYKAMVVDMKEKKGKRKVAGIDKFTLMSERYQGIPEYKQAYEWYQKTLRALEKKWNKMLATEKLKRSKLQPAQKERLTQSDNEQYQQLEEQFEADGEKIAAVWYNPNTRNEKMLIECCSKVKDALMRSEKTKLDEYVGAVPTLLTQYWEAMDKARNAMLNGDLDGADNILKSDPVFKIIPRLKSQLLPSEYRDPLMAQHKDMSNTIRTRQRDYLRLKTQLERHTGILDRSISSMTAQLDAAFDSIQAELDQDNGDTTREVVNEEEPKPAEESAPAEEAAPAEAAPAETEATPAE
ncbi:MAG: hypothetical protein ACI4OS_00305 [Akkermansia sp.]